MFMKYFLKIAINLKEMTKHKLVLVHSQIRVVPVGFPPNILYWWYHCYSKVFKVFFSVNFVMEHFR